MSEIINDDLNDENFIIYAIKAYERPTCIMSEFEEDMKRIKYLKRLFYKFEKNDDLKERLILNHLIILYNVFGKDATKILFFKLEEKYYPILKAFLIFLNHMPKVIKGIKGKTILSSDIMMDQRVIEILRKI